MSTAPVIMTVKSWAICSASRPAVSSADCGIGLSSDEAKQRNCRVTRTALRLLRCAAMAQTAADILIDVLQEWGVDTVFGLPGDGINGIMESLRTRHEAVRFIQVRHE